jgi:tRNA 2-selenouridine synthase SelU
MNGVNRLTDLINDCLLEPYVHNQISAAIEEIQKQLVEHSKIAERTLSIGADEGWFEWKDESDGAYISLHKDLEKIRDLKEVQDYIRLQNMYIDSLKLKITDLSEHERNKK